MWQLQLTIFIEIMIIFHFLQNKQNCSILLVLQRDHESPDDLFFQLLRTYSCKLFKGEHMGYKKILESSSHVFFIVSANYAA